MFLPTFICLSLFIVTNCQSEFRDVNTNQGPVRGFSVDDDDVFSFYGIPYATAPSGEDRFKAPLPPPTWTDTFNATTINVVCPQGEDSVQYVPNVNRTLDCLILNVFVPATQETNLPVYVYIYGGGYQAGFSTQLTPIDIVKRGIIAVSMNYRLNLYGFLCLGTEYAPGNAGVKDQVAALRWVQRNIANFGGNPDIITIGGNSAGSASSELQLLSPMSNGLFTQVILESGSTLPSGLVDINPLLTAERFANSRGVYTNQNVENLEEYFRSITDEELSILDPPMSFNPCIESHNLTGVEKFLTALPLDIIREGTFETRRMLTGFTSMEGGSFIDGYANDAPLMAANFSDFLPSDIPFDSTEHQNEVAEMFRNLYFPTGEIALAGYVDYTTDRLFSYPMNLAARLYAENSMSVYFYLFSYNGTVNNPPMEISIWGPGHIVQSLYLYELQEDLVVYEFMTEDDYLTQERLRTMWSNFIKYGEPIPSRTELLNVTWEPFDNSLESFLNIDTELHVEHRLLPERLTLWDEVYGNLHQPIPDSAVVFTLTLPLVLLVTALVLFM